MDVRTWYLCKSEVQVNLFLKFCGTGGVTVIGLQKVLAHIISKELLRNQKGSKAANHCLRSLLESMVDLKELLESSETDGSDTSSDSKSESASGDEEDDDDHSIDVSSSDMSEHEETEEEFLERYAQTARELRQETKEDAENGQDEDGHEIELGVLALVDYEKEVLACLKQHGKKLSSHQSVPKELLTRFREKYPEAKAYV